MTQFERQQMHMLLTALKRLEDPEDPVAKALLEGGYIVVNPDGIELSPKGELELQRFVQPTLADAEFERVKYGEESRYQRQPTPAKHSQGFCPDDFLSGGRGNGTFRPGGD
jgi:hypothetical protein